METRLISMAMLSLGMAAAGCRSKLDVKSDNGAPVPATDTPPPPAPPVTPPVTPPAPTPTPPAAATPVDDSKDLAMAGTKIYFQTRDTITLAIDEAVIKGAPTFTVLNTTKSGTDDEKAVKVIEEAVPSFGLADDKSFSLDQIANNKLLISFYPGQNNYQGKFFYGKNTLKVVANDNVDPRFAIITLTLQDFDIFDVAITSFANNVQVATAADPNGYQFQGWVNVIAPPTVTASDNTVLTTGMFNMVNPTF